MKSKVLLYMELPPPMHGMTYINKIIYNNLKNDNNYNFYNTNFTLDVNEVGNLSFKKVIKNLAIIFGAWKGFFTTKPDKVYSLLSASLFGIIRDFMINMPAILLNKQLVLHLHGFTYYKIYQSSSIYKILFDIMSKDAQLIVLCEKQKVKTFEIMSKESVILYNCLEASMQHKPKVKNEILQICYISNISKQKGTFELIKAVQSSDKNIKLVIAGNFLSDKDEFFELIFKSKNISYLGFADEKMKEEILSSSDIFCLPSKLEEGSPISIIEAMSYGLPIIVSDKGCIKDMVEGVGYVLPNDYVTSDILDGLQCVENNYNELSSNAIKKYKENYSKNKFLQDFKLILKGKIKCSKIKHY